MKFGLKENTLFMLSNFIANNLALHFPKERWTDLERNILSVSNEFGYQDVEKFVNYIMTSPLSYEHIEILTSYLTNNETYFWREHFTFEILGQKILPELISMRQNDKRIRIWSAGCSTGEEPYSIAIALSRVIPNIKDWDITILAIDISPRILIRATVGIYNQWAFRNTPGWLKEKYFLPKENNKFEIIPAIRNMVKFEYMNLADDVYPSPLNNTNAMDVIFCRNVLMYFTQNRFKKVTRGLYNSLIDGGYLVVSASELSLQNFAEFIPVNIPGMVFYQKTSKITKNQSAINPFEPKPEAILVKALPDFNLTSKFETAEIINVISELKENPTQIETRYEEVLKLYSLGYYTEVIEKLKNESCTGEKQKLLIRAYTNTGNLTRALNECEKAIKINKLDARLYYLQAIILQEKSEFNAAVVSLKNALYLDPNFIISYYALANTYQHLGNINSAKKGYDNVLALLNKCDREYILPESEGLTAGRLKEILNSTQQYRVLL
ncbi:MAG: CheR family methyltransferase [bacterium]